MKISQLLLVALAAALVCFCTTSAVTFNLISDIHLDPAYGTSTGYKCNTTSATYGKTGCDSPAALLTSMVEDVSKQKSAYTVFCGDFQRHGFAASGLTAAQVFGEVASSLASITTDGSMAAPTVITTLGNNDVVPDYTFDVATAGSNAELNTRVDLLATSGLIDTAEQTEMKQCGYYARSIASAKLTFISLHTLLWTYSILPAVADTVADPCGQFAYLSTQLASAKAAGNKVIIIGHIPPTPNVYSIVTKGAYTNESVDMYWKAAYVTKFNEIVSTYADTIIVQLYGHSHEFSLGASSSMGVPFFIVPAISPIYANRPSYFVADFDSQWNLRGLWQRYLSSSNVWTDGMNVLAAMGLTYGFSNLTTVQSAAARAMTDSTVWKNFLTVHSGGEYSLAVYPKSTCNTFCRAATVAAMTSTSYANQKTLSTSYVAAATPTTDINLSGSIVTTVLILGCVVAVVVILALVHCIPRCRSGEIKMKMPDIDWKAELLNSTPKKEKQRLREEKEARRQAREEQAMRDMAGAEGSNGGAVHIDVEETRGQDASSVDPHYRNRE